MNLNTYGALSEQAPSKVTVDVLERLLDQHMAFYVDWALLNSHSPDYDPAYKPEFPPIVKEATEAIAALRRIQR